MTIRNALLGLILLGILVYVAGLWNGFVVDDHDEVEHNPYITSLAHLPTYFSRPFWSTTADPQMPSNTYRPLKLVGYAFEYKVGGNLPWVYHLGNLIYHILAVTILFVFLSRHGVSIFVSFVSAAFFELHPANSEVAYYISGRPESLAALFLLLSLLVTLSEHRKWMGLVPFLFFLSLLSKEIGVILIPALMYFAFDRKAFRHVAIIGIFAAWILYQILKWHAGIHTPVGILLSPFHWGWWKIFLEYLVLLFFPFAPLGYRVLQLNSHDWLAFLSGLFFVGGILWAFRKKHHSRLFFTGLLITFPSLALASSLTLHSGLLADRYVYFPALGMALIFAATVRDVEASVLRAVILGCLFIMGLFSFLAGHQWKDDVTFWKFASEMQSPSPVIERNLGGVLSDAGDNHEAMDHFKRALLLSSPQGPDRSSYLASVQSLGALSYREGNLLDSLQWYLRLRDLDPQNKSAWMLCAIVLSELGRCQELKDHVEYLREHFPHEQFESSEWIKSCHKARTK